MKSMIKKRRTLKMWENLEGEVEKAIMKSSIIES